MTVSISQFSKFDLRNPLIRLSVLVVVFLGACSPTQWGGAPVVWPKAARLGDTVAMSISSNHVPFFGAALERYHLSEDNVTLEITHGGALLATVAPRAVFDGLSAPTSLKNQVAAGPYLTIAVFDLPASLPVSLPAATTVGLLIDGVVTGINGKLDILDTGGSPTAFTSESEPGGLGPRSALRLQGRAAGTGVEGFDPAWQIGALEFRLEYPSSSVSEPDAFPGTEASRALVFTSAEDPPGSVRVLVTDPRGFILPSAPGYPGGDRVGEGPLLDVAFAKAPGQGFEAEDFTIRDLKVFDPDGVLLTPIFSPGTDTTHYFARSARKNLAE